MDGGLNYYDEIPHKRARDDLPLTPTMFGAAGAIDVGRRVKPGRQ